MFSSVGEVKLCPDHSWPKTPSCPKSGHGWQDAEARAPQAILWLEWRRRSVSLGRRAPPGYDAIKASAGCGQQALEALRDESIGGWAWARRRQSGRGGASRRPSRATRRGLLEKSSSRQPGGGDFWAVVLTFGGDVWGPPSTQGRRPNPSLSALSTSISKDGQFL